MACESLEHTLDSVAGLPFLPGECENLIRLRAVPHVSAEVKGGQRKPAGGLDSPSYRGKQPLATVEPRDPVPAPLDLLAPIAISGEPLRFPNGKPPRCRDLL